MSGKTFADAVTFWRNGRRAEAEHICRALIAEDSKFVDAHRLLAEILEGSGRTEAAFAACRRVADLAPTDAPILQRMGALLLSLGRPEEALAAFDHAISRAPSFARAHAGRGMTLIGFGRDQEAVDALARAVHIDPRGASPLMLHAGYHMLQLGRADNALAAFARLAELQPDSLAARQGHAITLVTMRRYADAVGVQALEDDLVAATNCAEDVIVGKFEPIQRDLANVHHPMPEFLFPADHGITGHAGSDKESCEPVLAQIRIGVGEQYCRTGGATAGDEDLVPVDCPAVAAVHGASSQTRKI